MGHTRESNRVLRREAIRGAIVFGYLDTLNITCHTTEAKDGHPSTLSWQPRLKKKTKQKTRQKKNKQQKNKQNKKQRKKMKKELRGAELN